MKKILDFFKTNTIIAKWTIGYFLTLWVILKFLFRFDMFDLRYWWKFFHATLHGFSGFVFGTLIYSAIPIYIASVLIIYRTKTPIIQIPLLEKVSKIIFSPFVKKNESEPVPEITPEPEPEKTAPTPEYPDGLPPELRVPFMRAKKHLPLKMGVSVYNKQKKVEIPDTPEKIMANTDSFPIPTDFDMPDNFDISDMNNTKDTSIPTFTDINFDEPVVKENLENKTTKYLASKNIEFETYSEFVATEKYVIYEHNDPDFWIMDVDSWFAAGKQRNNPTKELLELAKQNDLIPVLYLAEQNIMDADETIKRFENDGIRVIKKLDELY
jgi:hypothetical protein